MHFWDQSSECTIALYLGRLVLYSTFVLSVGVLELFVEMLNESGIDIISKSVFQPPKSFFRLSWDLLFHILFRDDELR